MVLSENNEVKLAICNCTNTDAVSFLTMCVGEFLKSVPYEKRACNFDMFLWALQEHLAKECIVISNFHHEFDD